VLPWSRRLAEQLTSARRESEGHGQPMRMRKPFDADRDESEQTFFAEPQQAPPEKAAADDGPLVFQRPDNP
jgi:hypothetical protein